MRDFITRFLEMFDVIAAAHDSCIIMWRDVLSVRHARPAAAWHSSELQMAVFLPS